MMTTLLIVHITLSSLGYLLFAWAFGLACLYLYRDRRLKTKQFRMNDRFPWSLNQLDRALFLSLAAGFVLMGAGLLLGVVVQNGMQGSVDLLSPRIVFPFFIWFFYLALLLFRGVTGLRGRIPAHLCAYGFTCVAISFLYELHKAA